MKRIISLIFFLVVTLPLVTWAAPNLINYQGVLTDKLGAPISNATQQMTFRLYDAETGGTLRWEEVRTVDVQNGSYNLLLGSVTTLDPALLDGDSVWLEVLVDTEVLGGRQRLASVPYALQAGSLTPGVVTCLPDTFISCYSGPAITRGEGVCSAGTRDCQMDGHFAACYGEVLPRTEVCNGLDDDCNGLVDDNALGITTWYLDSDSDGYGDTTQEVTDCTSPVGYSEFPGDCNDAEPLMNPGIAFETSYCSDGLDNDCDGVRDCQDTADCGASPACTACVDGDADSFFAIDPACPGGSDCNDAAPSINPDGIEICGDMFDNNCDGLTDCSPGLVINEVDYDQPGAGDAAEFIEILNTSTSPIDLAGYEVSLINGNDGSIYATYQLDAAASSLAPGGYLVIGSVAVVTALPSGTASILLADNSIQNGAPDGVHLFMPSNALAQTDSLVYEGSISGYGEGLEGAVADSNASDGSLSRCPNGFDTDENSTDFHFVAVPTPGITNSCP